MDKIIIKGLKLFAYHGLNPEEQQDGQIFEFDIKAQLDLQKAGQTDDIEDTVSYAKIIKTVKKAVLSERNDLIERVAHRAAEAVLNEYDKIQEVKITVKKPNAPIDADFDYTAVEISRRREPLE